MEKTNLLITCDDKFFDNKQILSSLKDGCNVFLFFRNEYDSKENIVSNVFDAISNVEDCGFQFINNILVPLNTNGKFSDNVLHILWFTNNIKTYKVYKDSIREKSIWKDVEWGKREKNYNKNGKDPGNVWIPTTDDGKGNITSHIRLGFKDIVKRIINFASKNTEPVICSFDFDLNIDGYNLKNINCKKKLSFEPHEIVCLFLKNDFEKNKCCDVFFKSSESMEGIPNNSLDLMVTSPPYWDIKNYFKEGQIGQESYLQYQNRITKVWKQCFLKLKDTGSMWINVNTIFKNKKLVPIPGDIIVNCKKIGFKLKACFIWHKSSAIPTKSNNLCDHFEYFFVFTKTDAFYLNGDFASGINDYLNNDFLNGCFWNINRKAGTVGKNYIHPAVFPLELIERVVSLGTKPGCCVLDPFLGSGTSLIAAINNKRNFVGFEYNEGFKDLINFRVANECKEPNAVNYIFQSKNNATKNKIFRK